MEQMHYNLNVTRALSPEQRAEFSRLRCLTCHKWLLQLVIRGAAGDRAESCRLLPQPVNDARSRRQCSTFLPDHTIPTFSSPQEGESGQWLNDKVSDSAPRTERTPKVTAFLGQRRASIMWVVAVLLLLVCACGRSRKVFRWSRSYLCECPPPAEVSAECPLSTAVQRRGGGAGSSLAGETHLTSFTSTGIQTGRQCRQAGKQAGGHKAAAVNAIELRQYCFRLWLAK